LTTGFGDIPPNHDRPWDVAFAITLMLTDTIPAGIFVAYAASLLTPDAARPISGSIPVKHQFTGNFGVFCE
jgi:hypothetical protein